MSDNITELNSTLNTDSTIVQLDMENNKILSSSIPAFAESKEAAKKSLGSVYKVDENDLLVADPVNKRAIIIDLPNNRISWEYISDRYVVDFQLASPDTYIEFDITDAWVGSNVDARTGTVVIWKNSSSQPITIYSGTTNYTDFQDKPDLDYYGEDFESPELQSGERFATILRSEKTYDWFVYPTIVTSSIKTSKNRLNENDGYLIVESDAIDSPFAGRIAKLDKWGNITWEMKSGYIANPKDVRVLMGNKLLISV